MEKITVICPRFEPTTYVIPVGCAKTVVRDIMESRAENWPLWIPDGEGNHVRIPSGEIWIIHVEEEFLPAYSVVLGS